MLTNARLLLSALVVATCAASPPAEASSPELPADYKQIIGAYFNIERAPTDTKLVFDEPAMAEVRNPNLPRPVKAEYTVVPVEIWTPSGTHPKTVVVVFDKKVIIGWATPDQVTKRQS